MTADKKVPEWGDLARFARPIVIVIVVAVLVALVWLFNSPEKAFLYDTINAVVINLYGVTGIDPTLLRGIVAFVTIPFFAALGTSIFDVLIKKANPLLLYKDWKGRTVILYIAVYFIVVGAFKQEAPSWCVETPEGIKGFATKRTDPVYKLPSHPCTQLEIEIYRGHRKVVQVRVDDPAHTQFFNTLTQPPQPLLWYAVDWRGEYEFFNGPGNDGYGNILRPVTPGIVKHLIAAEEAANTSPGTLAAPSNISPQTPTLQVNNWVANFLSASEGPSVDALRPFFDTYVSPYFSRVQASWNFIAQDKQRFFDKFHQIRYSLQGRPEVVARPDGSRSVEFTCLYTASSKNGDTMRGSAVMSLVLRSVSGAWKIEGISEAVTTAPKESAAGASSAGTSSNN